MSTFTATKCDHCGAVKKEDNHWFQVQFSRAIFEATHGLVNHWKESFGNPSRKDLCGRACMVAEIAEWMADSTEEVK